ncbi:MAG: right-handed parallel beta-helix repeat-containing protein [Verrucomicrobiales bacterium]|nr:right-handed parallel beta-helix repeat-containing protein [Verrucomicrobiales bacterium]
MTPPPSVSPLLCLTAALALIGGLLPRPVHAQQDLAAQIPGLASLPDATDRLQAELEAKKGELLLPAGQHRITRPLVVDLAQFPDAAIRGVGGKATLIMDGAGPAIRLSGSHQGSADPKAFQPATWNEATPLIADLTILGNHAEADGIELFQTVQPIVSRVAVRGCRHGIHLVTRNRNVLISDCHVYENEGVGIYLDDVNLHQINITGCHVSYNRAGGIVVRDGNVRNLQITGCDIESNMPGDPDTTGEGIANVLLDVSGSPGDASKSIAEVAITGCTIQHSANYGADKEKTIAPGGANIRLLGKEVYPIDTVTITGNVMSDTTLNVHLDWVADITLAGNTFFAPKPDHLVVSHSRRVTLTGNSFNPREFERPGALRFTDCADVILASSSIHRSRSADGAVILERCEGFVIQGLNLTDCDRGLVLKDTRDTLITGCRVARTAAGAPDLEVDAASRGIQIEANRFAGTVTVPDTATAAP